MDVLKSEKFYRCFSTLMMRSNIDDVLIKFKTHIGSLGQQTLDLDYIGVSGPNKRKFSSIFEVSGETLIKPTINDIDVLTLFIYYLKVVEKDKYNQYCPYPPENLLVLRKSISELKKNQSYIDKTVTQICDENDKLGCKFPMSLVKSELDGESLNYQLLSYKFWNSLGEKKDLKSISKSDLNIFKVSRDISSPGTTEKSQVECISTAINYVDFYYEVLEDQLFQSVLLSKRKFLDGLRSCLQNEVLDLFNSSVICKGAEMCLFNVYKYFKTTDVNLKNFVVLYNHEFAPVLEKLFKRDMNAKLSELIEKGVVDTNMILNDIDLLKTQLDQLNNDVSIQSSPYNLSKISDKIIFDRICKWFEMKNMIQDRNLIEAVTLMFFSYLSTSPNIRSRDERFQMSFTYNSKKYDIDIDSKKFLSWIDGCRNQLSEGDRNRNYLRVFCAHRANKAIRINELFNFTPRLFSNLIDVPNHIRIDFYKGLDHTKLTKQELIGLEKIRSVTEYRSRNDEYSRQRYADFVFSEYLD
uniref:61 kDa protein n=1 Tax=Grapevine leafroll-associated virus 7 TaxID=217615 RepID=A0A5A4DUS2_9CLOS|nr:61 kDa protein [Grapevine leafroll-associated virus 7]